jgi:hypothetical protein
VAAERDTAILGRQWDYLERRAPSRLESDFQFKLAETVPGAPFTQTMPRAIIGLDLTGSMRRISSQIPSHNIYAANVMP